MTLTKDEIVKALAKENGFPLNQSVELIETLIEIIKHTLSSGEDVLISGFGKFCINEKQERRGRNPATRESILLKPRRVVTFRCSRQLRAKINQQGDI
jgi:integration host factor subunit alpha